MSKQKKIIFTKLSVKESQNVLGGYDDPKRPIEICIGSVEITSSITSGERLPGDFCRE